MSKKTWIKIFALVTVLLTIIVVSSTIYLVSHVDDFKQLLITEIEDSTGRKFSVGEARMTLSLQPKVTLKDVSFENASWGKQPQMLRAASLSLRLKILPLLSGTVSIDQITLDKSKVVIETDSKGRSNWDFEKDSVKQQQPAEQDQAEGENFEFRLAHLKISDSQLYYRNGVTGFTDRLQIDQLTTQGLDADKRFKFKLQVTNEKTPIKAHGTLTALQVFLQNKPYNFDLTIESPEVQFHGKGKVEQPMEFKGWDLDLSVKADKLSSLSWLAGGELPALGPLEASAHIKEQGSIYRLENLKAQIGTSDISGMVSFAAGGKRPKLVAQLTSKQLTPTEKSADKSADPGQKVTTSAVEKNGKNTPDRVFSAEPLPFSSLNKFDADISLQADKLNFDTIPLQNLNLKLLLEDGLLTIKNARTEFGGGSMTVDLKINSKLKEPTVSTRVHISKVDLGELSKIFSEEVITGSKSDLDLVLSGQGNSARDLAASLNGEITWTADAGLIQYAAGLVGSSLLFGIARKLNPLVKDDKNIKLKCWVLHYDIVDGIATTDKRIAFDSDKLQLLGTGSIDFKTEEIKLLVSSNAKIAGLIQVDGSLADPQIHLNPVGVLKEGVSLGAAIFTVGISRAVETVFHWTRSGTSPCEIARRETAKKK